MSAEQVDQAKIDAAHRTYVSAIEAHQDDTDDGILFRCTCGGGFRTRHGLHIHIAGRARKAREAYNGAMRAARS